jgi:DNA polymerase I-like protein with 3'-5' exonuclease and polymerase domains
MEKTGLNNKHIIKRINFGVPYGMGLKKMVSTDYTIFHHAALEHGYADPMDYAKEVYSVYQTKFPVLFDLMNHIEATVRTQGYIRGIGGRTRHKPRPELDRNGRYTVPYYKMVARHIQGSASEVLKQGIADSLDAGVFEVLPMHLSVHDENVVSVPYNRVGAEALRELTECMKNVYRDRLTVPLTVACETGPHWGYWNDDVTNSMLEHRFPEDAWNKVYAPQVSRKFWVCQNGYKGLDGVLNYTD